MFELRLLTLHARRAAVRSSRDLALENLAPHSSGVTGRATFVRRKPHRLACAAWRRRLSRKTRPAKWVAAFSGPRLRHFQRQGSFKVELKRSGSRVQFELKLRGTDDQIDSGVRTGNTVLGELKKS